MGLMKALWEKEKMLVRNIFFYFHNVFLPYQEQTDLSYANAFNLVESRILSFGKALKS